MENVFTFLGLPATHRTGQKITQHVKHYDEVPESKKCFPVWGQIKKDGVYALVVKRGDGEVRLFSRTGKPYTNTEHLHHRMRSCPFGVYITELCIDECSLETLSGIVNPNRVKPLDEDQDRLTYLMYMAFHDMMPLYDFMQGHCFISYNFRYQKLQEALPSYLTLLDIQRLTCETEVDEYVTECIAAGEEGAVFKQPDEGWVAGHKGFRQMKIVKGVHYDLTCIGWEEGTGKYKGKVVNLIFLWKNDKTVKAMLGKGWTHKDAETLFTNMARCGAFYGGQCHNGPEGCGLNKYTQCNRNPLGNVYHVYALQESSKGKLRLPKVGERRHDKEISDV